VGRFRRMSGCPNAAQRKRPCVCCRWCRIVGMYCMIRPRQADLGLDSLMAVLVALSSSTNQKLMTPEILSIRLYVFNMSRITGCQHSGLDDVFPPQTRVCVQVWEFATNRPRLPKRKTSFASRSPIGISNSERVRRVTVLRI
jgi:hypothetical protein